MRKPSSSPSRSMLIIISPRVSFPKLVVIIGTLAFLHLTTNLNLLAPFSLFSSSPSSHTSRVNTCLPKAWAAGRWEYNPRSRVMGYNDTPLGRSEDIFKYNGMRGCAADREFYWHLAADNQNHWSRFPGVTEWEWVPGEGCEGVAPLTPEGLVKDLVENGSWFVLGDSVTENHFFSLSCTLFPHVRATPNYTENPYFDRAWPQHLYLHPDSPLVRTLDFPEGFSIEHTPLVTFRRNDLLLSRPELEELHRVRHPEAYAAPEGEKFKLFSEEQHWTQSPTEYMQWFIAPAPMRYGTLLTNTGGHWTTTLLAGFRDEQASEDGYGIKQLIPFFGEAMDRWAQEVQRWMDAERARVKLEEKKLEGNGGAGGKVRRSKGALKRQVLVRAYLPGHEDCHDWKEPWTEWHPYRWNWYNWAWIGDLNQQFENVLNSSAYPDLHFLPIDRPALLRPDGHGTGDCLHLMSGSGVMEDWTRYMWHYARWGRAAG